MGSGWNYFYYGIGHSFVYRDNTDQTWTFGHECSFRNLNAYKFYRTIGILKIFVSISTALLCGSLAITGWPTVLKSLIRDTKTESLTFDIWIFQAMLMIGLGMMGFVALLQVVEDIIYYIQGKHLEGKLEVVSDV